MSLLIVGCGYVGSELLRLLRDPLTGSATWTDRPIYVLTRSPQKAEQLREFGVQPLIGHWLQPESFPKVPWFDRILVSVPHRLDEAFEQSIESDQQHAAGLKNLVKWIESSGQSLLETRLIYLSTTGVYGEATPGESVDETSPVSPTRPGPRIAVQAENWLSSHRNNIPSIVIRLAGIYGPGRIPLIASVRAGQPLSVPRQGTLNLIHVSDVAQAIHWSLAASSPNALYVLSDGRPVPREDFYTYLAERCGIDSLNFLAPDQQSRRNRQASDKRVKPELFWRDSGLRPIYPDYQSGIKSSLAQGLGPSDTRFL